MLPSHVPPGNYIYWAALVIGIGFALYSISVKLSVFSRGRADRRFDHLFERLTSLVPYLLGNARVARKQYWYSGLLHTLIYWGFIVLQIRTLNFLLKGFNEDMLARASAAADASTTSLVRAPMDLFNILVLVGCAMAAWQRRFWKPARMTFNMDAWLILFFIAFLMVTRHLHQQLRDRADPQRRRGVLVRRVRPLAQLWRRASACRRRSSQGFLIFWWYAHLFDFLVFLNYLPYSKHSHVLTVALNIALPPHRADRAAAADQGLRERERFGAGVHRGPHLEADARSLHLHRVRPLRDQLPGVPHRQGALAEEDHARHAHRHRARGAQDPVAALRLGRARSAPATNGNGQANGNGHGGTATPRCCRGNLTLIDAVGFNPIWDCVTCGACQYQCPVFIEHIPALQDMRRFLTMNEANMPETAAATLMQLEQRGHPWRGTPLHPHVVDGGPRHPDVRRLAGVPLLGRLLRRARRPQHPDHARRRPPADGGRRQLRLPGRGGDVHAATRRAASATSTSTRRRRSR